MRAEKLVSLNKISEQTVYYVSSYDSFSLKTLSGAAFESGERQKAIFAENTPPRADFLRTAPNGIGGQEFIPRIPGDRVSGGAGRDLPSMRRSLRMT